MEIPKTGNTLLILINRTREHLEALKYKPETIRVYECVWNKLAKHQEHETTDTFRVEQGDRFLIETYGFGLLTGAKKTDLIKCRAVKMLLDMQNLGIVNKRVLNSKANFPECFAKIFEEYILAKKDGGASKNRLQVERNNLHRFGMYLAEKGANDISKIDRIIVNNFLHYLVHCSGKTTADALRTVLHFLDFAYRRSYIYDKLSDAVPEIRQVRKRPIPSTYTEEEVCAILNAVDRGNPMGKRDYAILVLAAKLGIRAGDIKSLRFSNFDWDKWQINFIQQKTGKPAEFDITDEIADAVIDYLKYGRPESVDDRIFLRHTAPYVGFSDNSRLHNLIGKYMSLAGIKMPNGKRRGLHSLRHSLASRLLEQNVPITDIAKVLVHSSIDVTKIYTSIDINALCDCALEVPNVAT